MSRIEYLKNVIPMNMMFRLKYCRQFKTKRELKIGKGKHIFYLDAPDYGNIGDQAIAYAIRQFSKDFFPEYEFVEILQKDIASYIGWLRENISDKDIIFLTGGGNMGNYYRIYEAARRYVIQNFSHNKIIIFPQSIRYANTFFGRKSFEKSQRVYNRHTDLIVCAREKDSYLKMKHFYRKVILCPDIVLSLVNAKRDIVFTKKEQIGICLRNDMEQKLTTEERQQIADKMRGYGKKIKEITTVGEYGEINENNREEIIFEKLQEIGECRLLVTDRLHAMIFAILTKTPCIVFQNNNSKIAGTIDWFRGDKSVAIQKDVLHIDHTIIEMLQDGWDRTGINIDYSELVNAIRGNEDGSNQEIF